MDKFNQITIEEISYYVYSLIDPRNNKIFYIWKWIWNRVFQHAKWIIENDPKSEKEEIIKEIINEKRKIKYFIIRHKLKENEAFLIESSLIDLLTYENFSFNLCADLKNLVQWHYKSLNWIMSVEEIEWIYWAKDLNINNLKHNLMIININKTYKPWISLYDATRKSWKINTDKIKDIEYFACEYKKVIRGIFIFNEYINVIDEKWCKRIEFKWYEVTKENDINGILDLYLLKKIIKKKWDISAIHYFYKKHTNK